MLTRLRVTGFKSLVDVDVRLGPFTCIAGANGSGKSNLFDAILFLSALADKTLKEAASGVRGSHGPTAGLDGIFHRSGESTSRRIRFEVEMILPQVGRDDLGELVEAKSTLVRYIVELGLRADDEERSEAGPIELIEESLAALRVGDFREHLRFPHSGGWRRSVLKGTKKREFISMSAESPQRLVQLHQDGRSGRKFQRPVRAMPRTILSTVQAEYPTALLVRRELQSWRLLQLESQALRKPDSFDAPSRMGADGSHLPSTLYHLARRGVPGAPAAAGEAAVYARVAGRLVRLIDDVQEVSVARNEAHRNYTLHGRTRDGTWHPAEALSDGTLRFLALAVTELDWDERGLLCFEEPENGMHPRRISAMLQLLQDIAVGTELAVDEDNPLRQVLINTHSPTLVQQVPDDALLVAEWVEGVQLLEPSLITSNASRSSVGPSAEEGLRDSADSVLRGGVRYRQTVFGCLGGTWRAQEGSGARVVIRGDLMGYLHPSQMEPKSKPPIRRVMDREELQLRLPRLEG